MKVLISGHRIQKLEGYDLEWVKDTLSKYVGAATIGLSGMASGVDLWYCEALLKKGAGYIAYVPFEGQESTMSKEDAKLRRSLLDKAWEIRGVASLR